MTSGNFKSVLVASIVVEREDRQRRELVKIDELAESIARTGLINPIVITQDNVLVAGERRLTAIRSLGWTHIPVQYVEDLSYYELQTIELEENVRRVDLSWQDEVAAIERFHKLKLEYEEGWTQQDTANSLGLSETDIQRKLAVAAEMDNEVIAKADRLAMAHNIVTRNNDRKRDAALLKVDKIMEEVLPGTEVEPVEEAPPILNTDFHDWAKEYDGPKFNLIHCDFPYGINVADAPRMASSIREFYDDSPDVYWLLIDRLADAMNNVVADNAHLIFWHSMKFHIPTVKILTEMGWNCNPFPLIWHKIDNAGIAPDPQRGPRQTYEAAIFAIRGDMKVTTAGCVANSFGFPGKRTDAIHISEKPMPMLKHFLRMVCDEYTSILDPTCGSANALKVARDLGAARILGLEKSTDFFTTAVANWNKTDV